MACQSTCRDTVRKTSIPKRYEYPSFSDKFNSSNSMNYHQAEMSPEALALQFSNFIEEAHRLKNKYSGQISLLVGAETEFISSKDMDSLSRLMQVSGDKIEYLVGSVHHANEIPRDFDRYVTRRSSYRCKARC